MRSWMYEQKICSYNKKAMSEKRKVSCLTDTHPEVCKYWSRGLCDDRVTTDPNVTPFTTSKCSKYFAEWRCVQYANKATWNFQCWMY